MKEYIKLAEVQISNLCKSFGDIQAVEDLSMTIGDGKFVILLGPTGAGKTTTLRLISGIEKIDSGDILFDGHSIKNDTPAQRNVAMVFQQYSLYPHLTVNDNLAFPLRSPLYNLSEAEITSKVNSVAEILQISHKLTSKATNLSGGEMQRVSIGRALVRSPNIFLMDEPLSSLDAKLRAELRVELKRIQSEFGATVLYVTHDQIEAMTMATHVGVLNQGRLVQFGTPREIYENPANIYVAQRLGLPRINILPANLFSGCPDRAKSIGLRTEHIIQGEGIDTTVRRVEHLGDQTRLHLLYQDHDIVSLTNVHTTLKTGDKYTIQPKNPLYFDEQGFRLNS